MERKTTLGALPTLKTKSVDGYIAGRGGNSHLWFTSVRLILLVMLTAPGVSAQDKSSSPTQKPTIHYEQTLKRAKSLLEERRLEKAKELFEHTLESPEHEHIALGYIGIIEGMRGESQQAIRSFQDSIVSFLAFREQRIHSLETKLREMEGSFEIDQAYLDDRKRAYASFMRKTWENRPRIQKLHTPENVSQSVKQHKYRTNLVEKELKKVKEMAYPAFFYFKLGNLFMQTENPHYARLSYENAVNSDPYFQDAYLNLAVLNFLQGNCKEAKRRLAAASHFGASINPDFQRELNQSCP